MMRKISTTWMAVAVLTLGLGACGDGTDQTDRAGEEINEAGRDIGDAVDDAGRATRDAVGTAGAAAGAAVETADVKSALIADDRVEADDINVDTDHNTKTVTLKGMVQTSEQREIAEQIAMREAAGYRVDNQLSVGR